jgi:hypothetical protein
MDVLVPDRHRLGLVLQHLDAQAIRRRDPGLIEPVVVAGRHRHAGGLPFGHRLLDVRDDEADVVHDRAVGAAGRRRAGLPQMQKHRDAGEAHDVEIARLDRGAAHADQELLVPFHAHRVEMPVSHGDTRLVGRERLRQRRARRQQRHEPQG